MIGRTITIDRLLAGALSEYITDVETIQHALKKVDIDALKDGQERVHFSARKVAHLVVCALLNIDGCGKTGGSRARR